MGYNLKNARNGKSISKIPKWQSLRSLALKSKFVCQFELLENLEYIYGNCCWRSRPPATFSIQIFLIFLKFKPSQNLILMKSRSRDGLAAKGLLTKIDCT